MAKEFKKKYMHPTRRKLVDMVMTGGEYEKTTTTGWNAEKIERNVGDIWEDEYHKYEKKDGFTLKTSKNSEAFEELRKWKTEQSTCKGSECKTIKFTPTHKKLIQKTGFCANCLAEIETKIRVAGFWEQYEDYKVYTRMLIEGKIKLEELQQAYDDVKPYYEYINEDGTTDKWELPKSVEEVKADLMEMIEFGRTELEAVEKFRNIAFEILKDNKLEHYL
jgi:hypothetical protein